MTKPCGECDYFRFRAPTSGICTMRGLIQKDTWTCELWELNPYLAKRKEEIEHDKNEDKI